MNKPSFVYTTYIRTTPARLWQSLTDPIFTERYYMPAAARKRLVALSMVGASRRASRVQPGRVGDSDDQALA